MVYTYGFTPTIDNFKSAAGSKLMNVNGSVTPAVFLYAPAAADITAINELTVVLTDEGTSPLGVFGSLAAALSVGIKIEVILNGVTFPISLIKDNADLASRFTFSQFGNGSVLSILGLGTAQGFGNSNDVFVGSLQLPEPLVLVGSTGDEMRITIQDNLTAVDVLQMGFHAVKLL